MATFVTRLKPLWPFLCRFLKDKMINTNPWTWQFERDNLCYQSPQNIARCTKLHYFTSTYPTGKKIHWICFTLRYVFPVHTVTWNAKIKVHKDYNLSHLQILHIWSWFSDGLDSSKGPGLLPLNPSPNRPSSFSSVDSISMFKCLIWLLWMLVYLILLLINQHFKLSLLQTRP